jgi:protoporphyrinogen oxidase
VYVPELRFPFYRVGWYSNFSPRMAPPGCSSLYVELSSRKELTFEEILGSVVPGLVEMGIIRDSRDIEFGRLRRLRHAYVVFDRDHASAVETIEDFLGENRIVSCGRYGGWNYSSMEDAIRFGMLAAVRADMLVDQTRKDKT